MSEGIVYWKSKVSGKTGYENVKSNTGLGLYIMAITDHYFVPVSSQVRKIYNQE